MPSDIKLRLVVAFLLSFIRKKMNLVIARSFLTECIVDQHGVGHPVRIVGFKRHGAGSNPNA